MLLLAFPFGSWRELLAGAGCLAQSVPGVLAWCGAGGWAVGLTGVRHWVLAKAQVAGCVAQLDKTTSPLMFSSSLLHRTLANQPQQTMYHSV